MIIPRPSEGLVQDGKPRTGPDERRAGPGRQRAGGANERLAKGEVQMDRPGSERPVPGLGNGAGSQRAP